jgi:hypothetical protein
MYRSLICAAGGVLAALTLASGTAEARWCGGGWQCGGFVAHGPVFFAPRPVYFAPRPVYYAPAPVYYAPAPVYYAPAPVVYAPPVVGFGFAAPGVSVAVNVPLH